MYDVIIIGGGPAGFTAGVYAARAALKALLLEGATTVSQITVTDLIENYPGIPEGIGGYELISRMRAQGEKFNLSVKQADVVKVIPRKTGETTSWQVETSGGTFETLALIVATGANWRRLGVPGEEALKGRGVSYCATCDGPFFRNKEVMVVGGGDTAIQEALFLTRFAEKVTVIHRRNRLRATKILHERAFAHPKIEFIWESVVEEIVGKDYVEGVVVKNLPTGEKKTYKADGIFVFVGLTPNTELFRNLVKLDEGGYIKVNQRMETSTKGIFACGDCTSKLLRQVVTACGDGATAAFAAELYVEALKGEAY